MKKSKEKSADEKALKVYADSKGKTVEQIRKETKEAEFRFAFGGITRYIL